MVTHLMFIILLFLILLVNNPLSFLMAVMVSMMLFILNWFYLTTDYWSSFMMLMIFLVGLLLLYVYLLSLSTKLNSHKVTLNMGLMLGIALSVIGCSWDTYKKMNTYHSTSVSYDWMFQVKMELTLVSILYFSILLVMLYFFVKGMKKSMKSSK